MLRTGVLWLGLSRPNGERHGVGSGKPGVLACRLVDNRNTMKSSHPNTSVPYIAMSDFKCLVVYLAVSLKELGGPFVSSTAVIILGEWSS